MQLTSDEESIRSMAEDFFGARVPLAQQQVAAHAVLFAHGQADPHRTLCGEMADLGFFSQAVDEQRGGLGMRPVVSGLICEAAGRQLAPGLWLDQLLAVHVADLVGASACSALMEARQLASLAVVAGQGRRATGAALTAVVQFGDQADLWVVLGHDRVEVVEAAGDRVKAGGVSIDLLCPTAVVDLTGLVVVESHAIDGAERRRLVDRVGLLVAAYSVGAASRCLELAVEYVKQRQQFGRPVGSFQAIKHRAANAQIELIHARSAVYHALSTAQGAGEARLAADRCLRSNAESALQMHGGIGFTADVPMHLFLRVGQRLRSWPQPVEVSFEDIRRDLAIDDEHLEVIGS